MKEKTGQLGKVKGPGNKLLIIVNQGRQRLGATGQWVGEIRAYLIDGSAEQPPQRARAQSPALGPFAEDGVLHSGTGLQSAVKVQWRHAPL